MKKEIGSEFWDVPLSNDENSIFPKETKWLLSGRTALNLIIKDSGIKSISMPRWCCESMINPFIKNGVLVSFYDECPSFKYDAIFLIDYFGFANKNPSLIGYKGIVIRDVTHSIFSKTYNDADYYFGSLRKWAGFITGGFAWGKWKTQIHLTPCDNEYATLRKKAMNLKKTYINGLSSNKDFLDLFKQANDYLDSCELCSACEDDIYAARHFDVDGVKSIRRKNAKILIDRIGCMYELKDNDCPLFIPIKVEKRDALRKFLIDNNVYLPIHWPNHDWNGKELSLVCDQRYDESDMLRICNLIDNFYEEEGN